MLSKGVTIAQEIKYTIAALKAVFNSWKIEFFRNRMNLHLRERRVECFVR